MVVPSFIYIHELNITGVGDAWIDIDETLSEQLVSPQDDDEDTGSIDSSSVFSSFSSSSIASLQGAGGVTRYIGIVNTQEVYEGEC